ncbi:MAG: 2,3-bisphosphoglycerate-independent phosphoglycerate mutase [Bacillota bacterium]
MERPKPVALIIMDGLGINENAEGNAVYKADTEYLDKLKAEYPHAILHASGEKVGLPDGQMGNSEVGHLNLGAGRIVYQDYTRINKAVENGELLSNEVLKKAVQHAKDNNSALHLMGLLSDGGVHSHIKHLFGLVEMADQAGIEKVFIHPILDGRDTPPKSGTSYLKELQDELERVGTGKIATVSGRYYTMDRDNRWERTKKAYNAFILGEGIEKEDPVKAVEDSYAEGINDEFVEPAVIIDDGSPVGIMEDHDSVIFFNFRADRARQITRALKLDEFDEFERPAEHPSDLYYVCMTEYDEEFDLPVAFPPSTIENGLGEVLSRAGLKQLRIAETEKYAHVTFFFNGGVEEPYENEDRILVPSPKVSTYDLKPEMSAYEVKDKLLEEIDKDKYDFIVLNFANPDMVGHTGFLDAAVKAVETVDKCLSEVVPAILAKGGQALITADHGNSEKMFDEDGEPFTAHTSNIVPLIYAGGPEDRAISSGKLADIAPTVLEILGIEKPEEMAGKSLLYDKQGGN